MKLEFGLSESTDSARALSWCTAAASMLGAILVLNWRMSLPVAPQDEGLLLVYPDLILRGFVPYQDFSAQYGPATFYVVATAFKVFGTSVCVERFVGLAYRLLIVAACHLIGSRVSWQTGVLASVSCISMLLLAGGAGATAMFGATATAVWAFYCGARSHESTRRNRSLSWIAASGLLAGTTLWYRAEVGVVAIVAAVLVAGPRDIRGIGRYVLGLSIPLISLAIFVGMVGPSDYFDSVVADPHRSGPGRLLPIRWSVGLGVIVASVCINVAAVFLIRGDSSLTQFVWLLRGIAAWSVGLLPLWLQRADGYHIGYIGTTVSALATVSLGVILRNRLPRKRALLHIAECVVLTALLIFAAIADRQNRKWIQPYSGETILSGERRVRVFKVREEDSTDLARLLAELHRVSRAGERLFIGHDDLRFAEYNDTFIYFMLPQLNPAARYLEMNPGNANRPDSGVAESIAEADWVIQVLRYGRTDDLLASSTPGSARPNEVVRSIFCEHSTYGSWRLLRRCKHENDVRQAVP